MKKVVNVIAIIATLGCIVYFIILCKLLSFKDITWQTFITTTVSMVLNLILLWALNNALARIERLEKDVYKISDKQIKIERKKEVTEDERPYRQCKNCGAIERTHEKVCPLCNTPYDINEESKKQ